ncbi:MAG: hypothetical protein GVY07_13380 [Bacteroidetes bacterium]|jgi:hypothetical protein|nr:hypothetical protein [Bacteroidota bacterium]
MATLYNNLDIEIEVYFRYQGKRPDAFSDGPNIGANRNKKLVDVPTLGGGNLLELHIEFSSTFLSSNVNGKRGVGIDPGNSLGQSKGFNIYRINRKGQDKHVLVVKFDNTITVPEGIQPDEPQVLHPEDSPIFEEDDA